MRLCKASAVSQQVRRKARQWLQSYKEKKQLSEWALDITGSQHQKNQQVDERNKNIIDGVQVTFMFITRNQLDEF